MTIFRRAIIVPLLLLTAPSFASDSRYPNHQLLIEPAELAKSLDKGPFVILDVRASDEYEAGHIPNAHHVSPDAWKSAFDSETEPGQWGRRIGELGIGTNTPVVVYDDDYAKDAARVWWILRYWGVADVRLLNGGWTGWKAAGQPVSTASPARPKPVTFEANPHRKRMASKSNVLAALERGGVQIVDSRSHDEFCGRAALNNRRGGAIPGARHLEWKDLLDDKTQRFKSVAELNTLFEQAGIDPAKPVATHCQSGGRASVMAFGLELMGGGDVRNYYRGWSEWGNADDTPIQKPEDQ